MQNENVWQNLNAAMFSACDGRFQQRCFNPLMSAAFSHDSGKESSFLTGLITKDRSLEMDGCDGAGDLIKEGLKRKITQKHLENGTAIPKIEAKKKEPATPRSKEEDPEVIKKRRERNKIAATKCRKRKRERIEKLEKKTKNLEETKRKKLQERALLLAELRRLSTALKNHSCKLAPLTSVGDCGRTHQSMSSLLNVALFNSLQCTETSMDVNFLSSTSGVARLLQ